MTAKKDTNTDLVISIGGQEVLKLKHKPEQTSKNGNPLPFTTRGFTRVESVLGELRVSLNVIE